jgi:hypothetical protein
MALSVHIGLLEGAGLIQLHKRLGRMQELSGDYDAAFATYARLEAMGQQLVDQAMTLAALVPQAFVRAVPSAGVDPAQADSLTTRARIWLAS